VALSIEPAQEYRASSDTFWPVLELAGTVTIGVVYQKPVERDPLMMLINLMRHSQV